MAVKQVEETHPVNSFLFFCLKNNIFTNKHILLLNTLL